MKARALLKSLYLSIFTIYNGGTIMKQLKFILVAFVVMLSSVGINTPRAYANENKKDVVIVIDAGHGGNDPGALAVTGAYESDCNLSIALSMKAELESYEGVKVYLTREGDEWSTNTSRAMVAKALKADFLISIHNNSGSSTNTGALAYRSINPLYGEVTNDMCTLILENLSELGLYNGGVQTRVSTQYDYEDYYTIIAEGVRGGVPSIIVEHCFLSNPEDAAFLTNENGTVNETNAAKMGVADATAVATYFGLAKRTAIADGENIVSLNKGQSVKLTAPGGSNKTVSWYSIDNKIATVSEDGVVTAKGSGITNIAYKLSGGESGSCTIEVSETEAVALVGGIDPTFYASDSEFSSIKVSDAFAFVIYSDGSCVKVTPDYIAPIDFTITGVQDVEIKYGNLTGYLRVIHNDADYIPEVTLPAPEEETTTTAETETTTLSSEKPDKGDDDKDKDRLIKILIFVIAVLAILFIGILIYLIESKRRRNRGYRRRGRRRYR